MPKSLRLIPACLNDHVIKTRHQRQPSLYDVISFTSVSFPYSHHVATDSDLRSRSTRCVNSSAFCRRVPRQAPGNLPGQKETALEVSRRPRRIRRLARPLARHASIVQHLSERGLLLRRGAVGRQSQAAA